MGYNKEVARQKWRRRAVGCDHKQETMRSHMKRVAVWMRDLARQSLGHMGRFYRRLIDTNFAPIC